MATSGFKNIVSSGLVMSLDAANTKSYTGSGTRLTDLTINGNNGTIVGPVFNTGKNGNFNFDGVNDYISTTNVFSPSSWTICLWINASTPISIGAPYSGLYCLIEGNSVTQFLGMYGTYLAMYTTNVCNFSFVDNPGWHYVSFVYDGTRLYGYVDDVSSGSAVISNPLSTSKARKIGIRDLVDNYHPYKGSLSIVKFYNRNLSTSEVLQNYNATKVRFI